MALPKQLLMELPELRVLRAARNRWVARACVHVLLIRILDVPNPEMKRYTVIVAQPIHPQPALLPASLQAAATAGLPAALRQGLRLRLHHIRRVAQVATRRRLSTPAPGPAVLGLFCAPC